ncbi:MAG: hypothetical protein K5660_08430 [Paludibacteraceae bacterium]|nr:hypothetical protein [Paludibacteraceae bacterium]
MKRVLNLSIVCFFILSSCGGSNSGTQRENRYRDQQLVVCPMCGGDGVFEYMPGDVMAPRVQCSGCNGSGQCTVEQAEVIIEAYEQVQNMLNPGGGYTAPEHKRGRSIYEIQRDIDKAYKLLHDMEYNYEHCSSMVTAAQYPGMIRDQRERIQRLEDELRRASY